MAEAASAKSFEMFDIFAPTLELLSHLLFEEFVMLILAVLPLFLGIISALRVMTGLPKGPVDAEEVENVCGSTELCRLVLQCPLCCLIRRVPSNSHAWWRSWLMSSVICTWT